MPDSAPRNLLQELVGYEIHYLLSDLASQSLNYYEDDYMITANIVVKCDAPLCEEVMVLDETNISDRGSIEAALIDKKWRIVNGQTYCPNCATQHQSAIDNRLWAWIQG